MSDQITNEAVLNEKPLATFALFAYNQENYIREAVEGAFSQTYSPLQIILSDDCSSDLTFQIMQEMAENYKGPHQVRLNKNTTNLGIAVHVNKLMSMVSGQFIMIAAGDDISIPERTAILVSKWIKLGQAACSIFTNAIIINSSGEHLGCYYDSPNFSRNIDEFIETKRCWVGGFSHGFSKDLYIKYGPITEETFQEDGAISFRALLNSGIYYIELPTVFYRRHEDNSYDIDNYKKFKKLYQSEFGLAKGRLIDLLTYSNLTRIQRENIENILNRTVLIKRFFIKTPGAIKFIFFAKKAKSKLRALLKAPKAQIK